MVLRHDMAIQLRTQLVQARMTTFQQKSKISLKPFRQITAEMAQSMASATECPQQLK